jgi:hypothetical protein
MVGIGDRAHHDEACTGGIAPVADLPDPGATTRGPLLG